MKNRSQTETVKGKLQTYTAELVNVIGTLISVGTFKGPKLKVQVEPVFKRNTDAMLPDREDWSWTQEAKDERTSEPIEFSEWVVPIVHVSILRPEGSIHICGDYKSTVNQIPKLDNYLIPKAKYHLPTFGGGENVTKLDLSQVYQQLRLDNESQQHINIMQHVQGCSG